MTDTAGDPTSAPSLRPEHQPPENVGEVDVDLLTQRILLASSQHDIPQLRTLLRSARASLPNPASVQDSETGSTPLHAAVAACEPEPTEHSTADTNGVRQSPVVEEEAEAARLTVKLLLGEGAIWNDLDKNDETAACIARRLGLKDVYELLVDAGVR